MRRMVVRALALAATTTTLAAAIAGAAGILAADWPQFRGIHRDGVSAETGLLRKWPDGGPRQTWRRPIGDGFSGVAVAGGRLYTMYAADHEGVPTEFAAALDPATGREIWRTPVGKRYDTEFGNGPRSTPTVEGDAVVVLGSRGALMALAAADGAVRWRLDLTEAFGSRVPTWGFSGSVLVDGGQVVLETGGPEGKSFGGIDLKTGTVLWTIGGGPASPGYNSPLALQVDGHRQYVHFMGDKVLGVGPKGESLWTHPWPDIETHAMPVFVPPDRIFGSGVEGVGAALLRLESGPAGAAVTQIWKNATFRTHFNAAVLHGEHLYGFDNATLKCIAVKDGSLAWAKRGLGKGSAIFADGHLLVLSDDGRLLLVEATPAGYVEKGMVQALQGRCWTPPALAGGTVYVRNHAEIVAYRLAAKG